MILVTAGFMPLGEAVGVLVGSRRAGPVVVGALLLTIMLGYVLGCFLLLLFIYDNRTPVHDELFVVSCLRAWHPDGCVDPHLTNHQRRTPCAAVSTVRCAL